MDDEATDETKPAGVTRSLREQLAESEAQQAELRTQLERATLLRELVADGYWDWNVSTGEIQLSPGWLDSLGYRPGDLEPRIDAVEALVHPDDRPRLLESLNACLQGRAPLYSGENRLRTKAGSYRWSLVRGKVVGRDEAGKPLRMMGVSVDIAAQKEAEEALRKSEEKFSKAFASLPEAVVVTRMRDGIYLETNEGFLQSLGYTRDEIVGHSSLVLSIWADIADRAAFVEVLRETGECNQMAADFRRKDGSVFPARVSGRAIEIDGEPCLLTVGQDMTDRKQAEEQQRKLEERLRQSQKMEAVGQLAGGIAHDFNNLLTVITGYGAELLEKLADGDDLHDAALEIQSASERAASLVRQLLAFSRVQVLQPQILDLNSIVDEMDRMLRRLIGEEIELRLILDPNLESVKADSGQIEQVVANLVVSARDAMPEGGVLTISTRVVSAEESVALSELELRSVPHVMLSVADTGIGMDAETKSQVFEPFFTTKEVGKGTGLGLSTVFGIAKQSGGEVRVTSRTGEGSTFQIFLPAVEETPQALIPTLPPREKGETVSQTILVVEDEEAVRALLCNVLESAGYSILSARHGLEAVEVATHHAGPIHTLLTDVRMPKMGGVDLSARLRALRPGIRVLFMSGYMDRSKAMEAAVSSGADFLPKPFTPRDLIRKLRELLGD